MKRGKEHGDQITSMGPMFPRLHVNDASGKGGPRAPPRNKMALYEQLSIPTQRFNHRSMPLSHNRTSNLVPPASSSQGSGCERNTLYSIRLPPAHGYLSEKFSVHKPDAAKTSSSTLQVKTRKRAQAEEDRTVPVYVQFEHGLSRGPSEANKSSSNHSMKALNASNKDSIQVKESKNQEAHDQHTANPNRLLDEPLLDTGKGIGSIQRNVQCIGGAPKVPIDGNNDDCDISRERTQGPLLVDVRERGNDVSEASMICSVSGVYISPDHVVGLIGQKQFWKARRELVNQQRVFAVQVFELHRLIKVQRLIAGSPHLLLEDISPKVLLRNKLNTEIAKPPVQNPEGREGLEKQAHRIEQSAENGVSNTSFSSVKRSHRSLVGNTHSIPLASDTHKMGFWAYHQQPPPKHQWLIPVMSPSEGLVYKPYLGPEYMVPYNSEGAAPFMNSFVGPAYGVPAHFPTYGASITGPDFSGSSVEQIHRFHQWSEEDPDRNQQHQSSCNDPRQKPGPPPPLEKLQENEVQGSTGSSPSERPVEGATGVLPLFPMAPRRSSGGSEPPENSQQPARVIKVIPHNRRSATESAARIFRSIQEERKLYE